jgi:hypothetical protein
MTRGEKTMEITSERTPIEELRELASNLPPAKQRALATALNCIFDAVKEGEAGDLPRPGNGETEPPAVAATAHDLITEANDLSDTLAFWFEPQLTKETKRAFHAFEKLTLWAEVAKHPEDEPCGPEQGLERALLELSTSIKRAKRIIREYKIEAAFPRASAT